MIRLHRTHVNTKCKQGLSQDRGGAANVDCAPGIAGRRWMMKRTAPRAGAKETIQAMCPKSASTPDCALLIELFSYHSGGAV